MDIEKTKACFLDRDGVLIEEKNYLYSISDIYIFPETYEALKLLKNKGFKIIVVTNQAGVAKGYYDENAIGLVHKEMDRLFAIESVAVDAYYYCPHHPKAKIKEYALKCDCRKPAPGMILQAVKDFDIDLTKSFLVGDKISDIEAASNAGCIGIMVKTGHGKEQIDKAQREGFIIKENILDAVKYFLQE